MKPTHIWAMINGIGALAVLAVEGPSFPAMFLAFLTGVFLCASNA